MFKTLLQNKTSSPINQKGASFILHQSDRYLREVQRRLNFQIDKRLVQTFFDLFVVILTFRNRSMGLLLSELGGYVCGFDHAPAGTKRISNLLRSKKWKSDLIDDFLFDRTKKQISELTQKGKRALLLWDDSRLEKPESWLVQGLCSVWSSKGKRLTKIKNGFFLPPASRICVPGFKWTAVLLSSLGGTPSVCQMSWWTTRGKFKEVGTNIIYRMLKRIDQQIGRAALHVFDRGYANTTMLEWLFYFKQDFVIRWKANHLLDHAEKGTKKTHLLARSFKPKHYKRVWDKERKKLKRISIAWFAAKHLDHLENQVFVVVVRDKNNFNGPMYLITSLKIEKQQQAWQVFFSYMHRWNIEQAFRFGKSELAMESPRLWFWENRLKLLAIVALVYDFLLRMLKNWKLWTRQLFKHWCHRTGNRYRKASIPIYRLRMAISNCLFFCLAQNSG
jgi:hypothetical protein